MWSLVEVYLFKSVENEALAAATLSPVTRVQYQRLAQQWRELAAREDRKEASTPSDISDGPSSDSVFQVLQNPVTR